MNGLMNYEKVSQKAIDMINESIDKCSHMQLSIDFTEQASIKKNEVIQKATISGYMIALIKMEIEISGVKKTAYKILDTPILYEYSRKFNQIISIPIKLLNTKETISSTPRVTIIRQCILNFVENVKNTKNKPQNYILYYDIIYKELEIDRGNKKGKADARRTTKQLLDYYVKTKYIKKYTESPSFKKNNDGYVEIKL